MPRLRFSLRTIFWLTVPAGAVLSIVMLEHGFFWALGDWFMELTARQRAAYCVGVALLVGSVPLLMRATRERW